MIALDKIIYLRNELNSYNSNDTIQDHVSELDIIIKSYNEISKLSIGPGVVSDAVAEAEQLLSLMVSKSNA